MIWLDAIEYALSVDADVQRGGKQPVMGEMTRRRGERLERARRWGAANKPPPAPELAEPLPGVATQSPSLDQEKLERAARATHASGSLLAAADLMEGSAG